MVHPGVGVLNVTAPLPVPPEDVSVMGVPTNPLLTGLLIVNGACGLKKVSAFAADDAAAYSAVAAFVATTEHVVFVPGLTVRPSSTIVQRAFAGAIA